VQAKVSEYSQLKTLLQSQARKHAGSLAVRDLSELLRPDQVVETENLTTLIAVLSKGNRSEWLSSYESLSDFVVSMCVRARLKGGGGGGGGEMRNRVG
jgi:V-type H+-transporting ATPase subunit C